MRILLGIVVALFASVGIAVWLRDDPGYLLVARGDWTVETSLSLAIVAALLSFVVLYLAVRALFGLLRAPRKTRRMLRRRRLNRAYRAFARGMRHLAEGRWKKAESDLAGSARNSPVPALHYVGAARAAQALDADWRRDRYLREAEEHPAPSALAVGLAKAEILLEGGDTEQARSTLEAVRKHAAGQPRLLALLAEAERRLGRWSDLQELLPELRSRKVYDEAGLQRLQVEIFSNRIAEAAQKGTLHDLRAIWKAVPRGLRRDETLLIAYAGALRDNDAHAEAESLLRDAIKSAWSDPLVVAFGQVGRGDAKGQLATAERWLSDGQDRNPYLLLTLGRLAKRGRRWEKARSYLEKSIRLQPMPDAYQELGEVLEEMNEKEQANQCYRSGLRLASGKEEEKEGVPLLAGGEETLASKARAAVRGEPAPA